MVWSGEPAPNAVLAYVPVFKGANLQIYRRNSSLPRDFPFPFRHEALKDGQHSGKR